MERASGKGWIGISFALGLLALVIASFIEAPFLLLQIWILLAFVAGVTEEAVKLLPMMFYRNSPAWERWKLIMGTGLFLGLIEGFLYSTAIVVIGQEAYLIGVRVALVGFHTLWAVITAGFMLGGEGLGRLRGLAFSMMAHALYDLPPLAIVQGVSGELVMLSAIASTGTMLLTPLMVKESVRRILATLSDVKEKGGEVTSSP